MLKHRTYRRGEEFAQWLREYKRAKEIVMEVRRQAVDIHYLSQPEQASAGRQPARNSKTDNPTCSCPQGIKMKIIKKSKQLVVIRTSSAHRALSCNLIVTCDVLLTIDVDTDFAMLGLLHPVTSAFTQKGS